ncbi:hypothetical protein [Butyrivibrio sp. WCD2001]|uniref:hypothetical protein n=1 Tax=Butyrivibrio sp. WCD2001 TaxID=1280681 RepID=UPI0004028B0F|nr:hypothetical protein [Butyrivibrio sp. WCD2001]
MNYKKVSVKDLVNVKKYAYGCKFEDSFLNAVSDDIADYDVSYLWYKDLPRNRRFNDNCECYISVRHKELCLAGSGYIEGEPTDEKVTEMVRYFIKGIKLHAVTPKHIVGGSNEAGFARHYDKREKYWL